MANEPIDLPQGTLDLLILKTLALEPQHGWAIAERIEQVSKDVLCIKQGSLYPALHKLESEGLVESEWRAGEGNRRAKVYQPTRLGRKQLHVETGSWERLSAAITAVLRLREV